VVIGLGVLLVVAIAVIAALLIGRGWGTPRDDSPEAGFARDMATHHAQAVEMSLVIRDASTDPELRSLAYDITVTQATQRGIFMGWLQQWGLPQASTQPRMAWMPGHPRMPAGTSVPVLMHGMASVAELQQLRDAHGVAAETLFLQLMIRHHEGGVLMARAIVGVSHRPEVVQMARKIDEGQRAEIVRMREMLTARGSRPLASLLE
jgi:uncharacterized protein (DUF305 family)